MRLMTMLRRLRLAALAAIALVACATDDGDELGGPEMTGPLSICEPDPQGAPPQSGHYEGRFAFSASHATTFPIRVDLDVEQGTVEGELAFADAQQSYAGELSGTVANDGTVDASFEATGDGDGTSIVGTVEGRFDARGGCGTWTNMAGQGGPWQVGELAAPAGAQPGEGAWR